jgi:hypothetical protein
MNQIFLIVPIALVFFTGFSMCSTTTSDSEKESLPTCFSDPKVMELKAEQAELNALAEAVISTKDGEDIKKESIAELKFKFPLFFAALNKELDFNEEIKRGLKDENELYHDRIDIFCKAADARKN